MAKEFAIWHRRYIDVENGKFVNKTEPLRVRVLARAEGYAMVRRPRSAPVVANERDLGPSH